MEKKFITKFGLRELAEDKRDFKLSGIMKLPPLEELPAEFELEPLEIKDQLDTDYCTQMACCGASELQEGMKLSPEWCFAVSKKMSYDPEEYGQDLRMAMKVHTKYGAIEKKETPYSLEKGDEDNKMRYISNWPPNLFEKAKKHQKKSFVRIDGQYDFFDDIRAFIWAFRKEKRAAVLGVNWAWPLDMKIMETSFAPAGGHAIYCSGWKQIKGETYLVIINSYGKEAGDQGKHYFPRSIINQEIKKYGAFAFIDMPPKELKKLLWSPLRRLWEKVKEYFDVIWQ